MKFILSLAFFSMLLLQANEYKLGHGIKLNDALHLGGYFSADYSASDTKRESRLDDVALMAYGDLSSQYSYLIELEATPFYARNYTNNTTESDMRFKYERFYLNYTSSDMFNVRVGKQITPIGYWNLEPINVLRDTSSNPFYSYKMFPKFITGVDVYGYLDNENSLQYHLFTQLTNDIDEKQVNIPNDFFIGASLEYELSFESSVGGAVGEYKTKDNKDISFVQLDAKYDDYPFLLQTEWLYNNIEETHVETISHQFGGYLQGVYNFNMKHALVGRYEYFDDITLSKDTHIGVVGYSYRPMYSVSLKAEYQFNSDISQSKSIISFSVLF